MYCNFKLSFYANNYELSQNFKEVSGNKLCNYCLVQLYDGASDAHAMLDLVIQIWGINTTEGCTESRIKSNKIQPV